MWKPRLWKARYAITLTLARCESHGDIVYVFLHGPDPIEKVSHQINQKVNHDSTIFYSAVLEKYISIYGDLPSNTELGKKIQLIYPD